LTATVASAIIGPACTVEKGGGRTVMTRVLVTGGAGFIGSHLADALVDRGDEVAVVDDLSTGRRDRLEATARLLEVDITDEAGLARAFDDVRPMTVFHLAAQSDLGVSVADPVRDVSTNVLGTVRVLSEALRYEARVVFASSGGAIYGAVEDYPTSERAAPRPEAPYGTAKLCAEEYVRLFNRLHGCRHVVLRFGNVYGPRQHPVGEAGGVVSILCDAVARGATPRVFGDGTQTRDYLHVADAVRALLAADVHQGGGLWNIGTGTETSVLDLLDLVATQADQDVRPGHRPARAGELQRSVLDCSLAEAELGWTATTPLEKGIASVYAWVEAGKPARKSS
jgi:UDP-glucose 4-epimerase